MPYEEACNKKLKGRIYKCICDYIDIWNSNDDNEDKIHYASLEEYAEDGDTIVSVFVDFANCDPSALVEMLEYLHDTNADIEDITLA